MENQDRAFLLRLSENRDLLGDTTFESGDFASKYINRELSWLEFNDRCLEEARDVENPLFERLNFISITGSNLDEFFMIRVASIHDQVGAEYNIPDPAGLKPSEQLIRISERAQELVRKQYSTVNRALIPALEKEQIRIKQTDQLTEDQLKFVQRYFESTVFPVLTPLGVDAGSPFPLIANKSLNLFVMINRTKRKSEANPTYAIVQIPTILPRIVQLPEAAGTSFILLEDIVILFIHRLFSGVKIGNVARFRITRNADLEIDDEEAADLLLEIEHQVRRRQWGEVIRLEIDRDAAPEIMKVLYDKLKVTDLNVYRISGPIDLTFFSKLPKFVGDRPDLKYPPFTPQPSPYFLGKKDIFSVIRESDVILNHPYESFDPVLELIKQASVDPRVLAIKQTLYRVSGQSPIIAALALAAERGKQVMVLVELKARFDEENNIQWAKKLEQAGCHVIYGLVGLKTHSKITLIVREEDDEIRRYVHLGTGNYNDITARIYTDLGLMTCSEAIGRDATDFFNMISGYSIPLGFRKLIPAPRWLREDTLFRIKQEAKNSLEGKKAVIVAKINSLLDPEVIETLYQASQAGVKIFLIVRGICALRPGIKGISENIHVRSLVGRYLEHSRIFYYYNDGSEDLFLGSADWMQRNLDRRIEVQFPVEDKTVRDRIFRILRLQLEDTDRARVMHADGTYHRVDRRKNEPLDSQIQLAREAKESAARLTPAPKDLDRFIPRESSDISDISESSDQANSPLTM